MAKRNTKDDLEPLSTAENRINIFNGSSCHDQAHREDTQGDGAKRIFYIQAACAKKKIAPVEFPKRQEALTERSDTVHLEIKNRQDDASAPSERK